MNEDAEKFIDLYKALKPVIPWYHGPAIRSGTGLAAYGLDGNGAAIAGEIARTAEALKDHSAGLGALRNSWRFLLAPLLIPANPDFMMQETHLLKAKKAWDGLGLTPYDPIKSFCLITICAAGKTVDDPQLLARIKSAYKELKAAYFWTAGPTVLPSLSLLAAENPAGLTDLPAAIQKFTAHTGGSLQTMLATIIARLAVDDVEPIARSVSETRGALKSAKLRLASHNLPLLSLAGIIGLKSDAVVETTKHMLSALKQARQGMGRNESLALNLAVIQNLSDEKGLSQNATLMIISETIAAILAQHAAMASVGAATAVVAGAT